MDQHPDLVLLDWMLPGISGIELPSKIRADKLARDLPIIMLTGQVEEEDRARGLNTDAGDYINKPFSLSEMAT